MEKNITFGYELIYNTAAGSSTSASGQNLCTVSGKIFINKIFASVQFVDTASTWQNGNCNLFITTLNATNSYSTQIPGQSQNGYNKNVKFSLTSNFYFECGFYIFPGDQLRISMTTYYQSNLVNLTSTILNINFVGYNIN